MPLLPFGLLALLCLPSAQPTVLYSQPIFLTPLENHTWVDPSGPLIFDTTRLIFWRLQHPKVAPTPVDQWDMGEYTGAPPPTPPATLSDTQLGLTPGTPGSSGVSYANGTFGGLLNLYANPVIQGQSLGTIVLEYNWGLNTSNAPFIGATSGLDLRVAMRVGSAAKTGVAVYSSWTIGLRNRVTTAFVWWETAIFDLDRDLGGDELWLDTISGSVIVHGVLGVPSAFHSIGDDSGVSSNTPWVGERGFHFTVSGAQVGAAMEAAERKFNVTLGTDYRDWALVHTNVEAEGTGEGRMGHTVRGMTIALLL